MVFSLCDAGNREKNEDCWNYYEAKNVGIYLVADGCGGSASGEIASKLTVEYLIKELRSRKCTEQDIKEVLIRCNEQVISQQDKYGAMKTTIVGIVSIKNRSIAFNVGDSRLYQIRDGKVVFNTEDHAVPYVLYKAGIIDKIEINNHEDRNKLLEAIGAREKFKINTYELDIAPDDLILLATDGFWEHIYDSDFVECLPGHEETWLNRIKDIIKERDDVEQDNYTALLVRGI